MRRRLAAAALAGLLTSAACGGDGSEGAETEIFGLEREPVDVLVTGVALEEQRLRVADILWSRGAYRDATDTLVIPKSLTPGDEVGLATPVALSPGHAYFVIAFQGLDAGGSPRLESVGVIDAASNTMLQPFFPAPADLLLPGETGADAELKALTELVRDTARFHSALEPPGPISRRLATALRLSVERRGAVGSVSGDGLAVDDYLLLAASRRTLSPDLPVIVTDTLGLEPLRARVRLPADFPHWGIGFWTSAGFIGPVAVERGQVEVDVEGVRPGGGGLTLVAWEQAPGNAVERSATSLVVGSETLRAELLAATASPMGVLYVDVAAETVSAVPSGNVEAMP